MTVAGLLPPLVPDAPAWPPAPGTRVALLGRGGTRVERELLEALRAELAGAGVRAALAGTGAEALALVGADPAALVAPVRVIWRPAGTGAGHGLRELAIASGPEAMRARAQRRALGRAPERCQIVVGDPATVGELRARWAERCAGGSSPGELARFVDRQADIVLERAARRLTGNRYRSPQGVAEELAASAAFATGVEQLAARLGRDPQPVLAEARACLNELSTRQQPVARDLWAQWSRFLYSRAYELRCDGAALERLRQLGERHPLVFLPSHRSNLDAYVMTSLLHERGFPPNHTLGGINMAFWPLGPIGRRVGVVFIRRSFRDDEVYKFALRRYLGFLVAKRFNLEWYIEGGRSRTGKLLPPRLGLFNYLADAVEEQGIDDVRLVPVSIVYDELQEVAEMAAESKGASKTAEGLGWLLRFAQAQQGSFGAVHVNLGEPIDLAAALRRHGPSRRLARSKVAFDVCTQINQATPVTTTSLVTLALLGVGDVALTQPEVQRELAPLLSYVQARGVSGGEHARSLTDPREVARTLTTLSEHGVVEAFNGGTEAVYRIGPDQELVAAFYRNAAIHWFITRSIVELALLAGGDDVDDASSDRAMLDEALALRDLLKFEFFFAEKAQFLREAQAELPHIAPTHVSAGGRRLAALGTHPDATSTLLAPRVLRSFLEASWIVAEHLVSCGDRAVDAKEATAACLSLGRQLRLQRRVRSTEAVSTHLFASALKLADNRGALAGNAEARATLAEDLRDVLARLAHVDAWQRAERPPTEVLVG